MWLEMSVAYELLRDMKSRRRAIPPEARLIGEYKRGARRIGRPVTQEELAEALGISREWYCALENGKFSDVSPELIGKVALVLYDRRIGRRVRWQREATLVADLAVVRRYVKRISSASNYLDAALQAIETGSKLLGASCVGIIGLEYGAGEIRGHAVGPRARFWNPLCDRVVREAHRPLRRGGVGVMEYVPTANEVAADPSILLAFESPDGRHDYEYACSSELWRDFNGDLGARSVIAAPLRDRSGYRGTLGFSWTEPRTIALREIELTRNLAAALELIS